MAIITWSSELSVNVKEIDDQHKKLIEMMSSLHEGMLQGKGKVALAKILQDLAEYTVYHFATEERYMRKYGYVHLDPHKEEHEDFIKKVNEFIEGYRANHLGLSIEVMNFLKEWLTEHIKGSDKGYVALFNAKGLT
jgi:hemerythrin